MSWSISRASSTATEAGVPSGAFRPSAARLVEVIEQRVEPLRRRDEELAILV